MTRRNDPCPCGSGKKFKQCCLSKQWEGQSEQSREKRFFERKHQLTNDLMFFIVQKEGGPMAFDMKKQQRFDPAIGRTRDGLGSVWALFFREYESGMRGIDWFIEERGKKYDGEDRAMLDRWQAMQVSCYQLIDLYKEGSIIEDIWSGERYRMPYCETMIELPPWSVAVGMIEPFMGDWCIHGAYMWEHPDARSAVLSRVDQLQEEGALISGRKQSPQEILSAYYPEFINLCYHAGRKPKSRAAEPTKTKHYVTRTYHCTNPLLLEDMLLDMGDDYILAPGTDPEEGTSVISRAEQLNGLLESIPADTRERLGLHEIEISRDLGNVVIENEKVVAHGWSDELEETVQRLEELAAEVGLTFVNEQRDAHQVPETLQMQGYNVLTERQLSEQEVMAYSQLPILLEWVQEEQQKFPMKSVETLIQGKEHEQYWVNPDFASLNLLRSALGLSNSPFSHRKSGSTL